MKRLIPLTIMSLMFCTAAAGLAMQGHGSDKNTGHGDMKDHAMKGTFMHEAVSEGVRAEFQVMSLESMNMKDPDGNTHHIMVKLFPEGSDEPMKEAVGKVKIISPSKKETTATLKDYSGVFAANFTADESGEYGVICLLKVADKKPLYKFWYPHMQ